MASENLTSGGFTLSSREYSIPQPGQKTSHKGLVLVAVVTQKWAEQEAARISG